MSISNGRICLARGNLYGNCDDCEEEEEEGESCQPYTQHNNVSGPVALSPWPRQDGSRLALGRLKAKLFETRLAAHVRSAQMALTNSLKHAGWAVEHKVSEVSRRGWNEATRAWGSGGGSGGGTLALTGGSGGPHERSSLLLGPGEGYQRLDNNSQDVHNGFQQDPSMVKEDVAETATKTSDWDDWKEEGEVESKELESGDGWGEDSWTSDWGGSNGSKVASPTNHSPATSPTQPSKKNSINSTKKNKSSKKAEQELLVDVSGNGSGTGSKGHTWDNWDDDDWEKLDNQ